jgi:hypothetical protein
MSNKDRNGFELEWILITETTTDMDGTRSRSRITVNPAYEGADKCDARDDPWALAMAMRDATVHFRFNAMDAVAAHIRDAHLFDPGSRRKD